VKSSPEVNFVKAILLSAYAACGGIGWNPLANSFRVGSALQQGRHPTSDPTDLLTVWKLSFFLSWVANTQLHHCQAGQDQAGGVHLINHTGPKTMTIAFILFNSSLVPYLGVYVVQIHGNLGSRSLSRIKLTTSGWTVPHSHQLSHACTEKNVPGGCQPSLWPTCWVGNKLGWPRAETVYNFSWLAMPASLSG